MKAFKADEFDLATMTPTGSQEIYLAESAEDAAKKCLYTRRLRNGNASLGPSKRVVYDGRTAWTLTTAKVQRHVHNTDA